MNPLPHPEKILDPRTLKRQYGLVSHPVKAPFSSPACIASDNPDSSTSTVSHTHIGHVSNLDSPC